MMQPLTVIPKGSGRGLLVNRHRYIALLTFLGLLCIAAALSWWNRTPAIAVQYGSQEQGPLRCMTYNIRHAEGMDSHVRLSAILAQIEQGKADFIALQEVDRYQWRSGLQDQASYLAKKLNMNYMFAPAFTHGFSQYGIALLSRYPLENQQIHPLPSGEGQEPRTVLTAQISFRGETVTLVTTHLAVLRSERERQMPALLAILHSIQTPIILMGDFNMPDSDSLMSELHKMLHKLPLQPSQATVANGGEIDHIFTSLAQEAPAWTGYGNSSDHLPVYGQIGTFN